MSLKIIFFGTPCICNGDAMLQISSLRSHLQRFTNGSRVRGGCGGPLDFNVNLVLFALDLDYVDLLDFRLWFDN